MRVGKCWWGKGRAGGSCGCDVCKYAAVSIYDWLHHLLSGTVDRSAFVVFQLLLSPNLKYGRSKGWDEKRMGSI